MSGLLEVAWPRARAGDALAALAVRAGLTDRGGRGVAPLGTEALALGAEALGRYLEAVSTQLHVEIDAATTSYQGIEDALRGAHPALLELPGDAGFVALLRGGRRRVTVLAPDLSLRRVGIALLAAAWRAPLEARVAESLDRLLDAAGLATAARARARRALLVERLVGAHLGGLRLLRRASFTPFRQELAGARAGAQALLLLVCYATQYTLTIASWGMLGNSVLGGRVDSGWLAAWLILLASIVPARLLAFWLQNRLATTLGAAIKRRILAGALRFDVDAMRLEGAGQLMGRAIDGSLLDQVFVQNGLAAGFAVFELAGAAVVLALGAGGVWHAMLLIVSTAAALALVRQFAHRHRRWVERRLELTRELIEAMVGNRTRVAQLAAGRWHEDEDRLLERFVALMRSADHTVTLLFAAPRIWQLLGFLGLAAGFVSGASAASLAIGVGGVQLAFQALQKLTQGGYELATAVIAWDRIGPLFHAASRREAPGKPDAVLALGHAQRGTLVLDASGLSYSFPGRTQPALVDVNLELRGGDRLLIEGPSGGGKSTLAALLAGARRPSEGVLLLGGLDAATLGADGWRRRVAAAPQFHENHVLCETLAFNLLFGRAWPAEPDDLDEAAEVCRELGLAPVIGRMPSGLMQMVGEGGWQLSHGERSRLYLARALLQRSEVVILDETFGALDPETMDQCIETVLRRARTLVVIAHP